MNKVLQLKHNTAGYTKFFPFFLHNVQRKELAIMYSKSVSALNTAIDSFINRDGEIRETVDLVIQELKQIIKGHKIYFGLVKVYFELFEEIS